MLKILQILGRLFVKECLYFFTKKTFRLYVYYVLRHGNRRRYRPLVLKFRSTIFKIPDALSFIGQFKDIFVDEIYRFQTDAHSPVILDGGANIGVSTLFFIQNYPTAQIRAYEADPTIFQYLKVNLSKFEGKNVELFGKAVWVENGFISFAAEGSDAGYIAENVPSALKVPTFRLKEEIEKLEQVDMLKLDIEGAETKVLTDCGDSLSKVKNIFVEFHSYAQQPQELDLLLKLLSENGFRYYISTIVNFKRTRPLIDRTDLPMDMNLNIFAYKS